MSNKKGIEILDILRKKYGQEWIDELHLNWDAAYEAFSLDAVDANDFNKIAHDYDESELDMIFDQWIEFRKSWYKVVKKVKFKNKSEEFAREDFNSTDLGGPKFACKTCGVIYFDNYAVCGPEYAGSIDYYKGNCSERCKQNMVEDCCVCDGEYKPFEASRKSDLSKKIGWHGTCSSLCFEIYEQIRNKRNYDKQYIGQVKRRMKKFSSQIEVDEDVTRSKVYANTEGLCSICGVETDFYFSSTNRLIFATIDHIIPISKGGSHTWENVQLLCQHCNSTKHDNFI